MKKSYDYNHKLLEMVRMALRIISNSSNVRFYKKFLMIITIMSFCIFMVKPLLIGKPGKS